MSQNRDKNHSFVFGALLEQASLEDNKLSLVIEDNQGSLFDVVVHFYKGRILRFQLGMDEQQTPQYDLINHSCLEPNKELILLESADVVQVKFEDYTLLVHRKPFRYEVLDSIGRIILTENMSDVNPVGDGENQTPPFGFSLDDNLNKMAVNLAPKLRFDEHIYGLGERFTEFDRRGQQVVMCNTDTLGCRDVTAYKNIPFYLSSYGYGLFIHSHQMTCFDIGHESTNAIHIQVPESFLEYYVIFGSPKDIVGGFTHLTGPAVLPPDWSFGLWYSTSFKGSSREQVEFDTNKLKQDKIPCKVFHFDCYWLRDDMWCDFVWDEAQYPNHLEMLTELKQKGYKICVWINPYVTIKTEMYQEGKDKGYFLKDASGEVYLADLWHGLLSYCAIVDFTNPEATLWYQEKVKSTLLEGVDAVKTDFGEDIPLDSRFFNGQTGKEMRNIYAYLYNKAVFEATEAVKGTGNSLVWARSGFAGMQKFPVCWSGDPHSSYEGMANTLKAGLSIGLSGVPFWSHDMGGFYGEVKPDVFVRWSQMGLFSSHSRLHGTTTRQPWAYGEEAYEIIKKFADIRETLMPYILKTAKECAEQGIPFIRPLLLEHKDDPSVYSIWDQYYFGDSMIIAPVFGGHKTERNVYLPQGLWQDYLTGEEKTGNKWYPISCDLNYMPIFIKKGEKLL